MSTQNVNIFPTNQSAAVVIGVGRRFKFESGAAVPGAWTGKEMDNPSPKPGAVIRVLREDRQYDYLYVEA